MDDAVNGVIETVIGGDGGKAFFNEPGVLDLNQQTAALLRY